MEKHHFSSKTKSLGIFQGLLILSMCLVAVSCQWFETRRSLGQLNEEITRVESIINQVSKGRIVAKNNRLFDDNITLLLVGNRVEISNAFAVRSWGRKLKDQLFEYHSADELIMKRSIELKATDSADLSIPELKEALKSFLEFEKKMALRLTGEGYGELSVYMGSDTPYSTVVTVLFNAGQAGFDQMRSVGFREENYYWVDLVRPKRAPGPNYQLKSCVEPRIALTEEGFFVSVHDGRTLQTLLGAPKLETDDEWPGKMLLGLDGKCPSVYEDTMEDSTSALDVLLDRTSKLEKPCFSSRVSASSNTKFEDLFSVLYFLQARKKFGWTRLEPPLEESSLTEKCASGLTLR